MFKKVCIFSGNANPALAQEIAQVLEMPLGKVTVSRFSDGETFCEIRENVRGVDAYVIQPTCSPVNDNVMELLIMADALRRASAGIDHRGHPVLRLRPAGPQGRAAHAHHVQARAPTSSSRPASTASSASTSTPGRSRASSTSPSTTSTRCRSCSRTTCRRTSTASACVVSPDAGGVERARAYSKRLDAHARHHRQAPRARQRERGHAPHRRRRRARTASSSTT